MQPRRLSQSEHVNMLHAFSVDVEDWYQGICLPPEQWSGFTARLPASMNILLSLLQKHNAKATCFILGKVAEEHPSLVREIHAAGHEIASHGYSHLEVYKLTPAQFREEIRRTNGLLEDLTGEQVIGYRAPYFSIDERCLWALDILCEEGMLYDSSIHPIVHHRTGIPDAERCPSLLELEAGSLLEIPVSTYPLPGFNLPVGGGTYLRLYPYSFLQRCLKSLEAAGESIGIYTHPWELDAEAPRVSLPPALRFSHYYNLKSTYRKLDALLGDFKFAPYREVYADLFESLL